VVLRIGEILVRDGLVSVTDVEDALVLARERRMRIASALVALGRLSADDAAHALARLHGVPAALEKHLRSRDVALAELLTAQAAWSIGALPLATQRSTGSLVVCVRDPSPSTVAALERATRRPVVLAVAPEILLLPLIAETYPVGDAGDAVPEEVEIDLDTGGISQEPILDASRLQLVELDDLGVAKDPSQILERQTLRPSTPPPLAMPVEPELEASSGAGAAGLDATLAAIASADRRDQVIDALVAHLRHQFAAGAVFVIEDGLALGQAGFGSGVIADAVAALAVPLASPSILSLCHDRAASFVGAPPEGSVVQQRFFRLFGGTPAQVAVVPVTVDAVVIHLLYGHAPCLGSIEDAAMEVATAAEAAGDAYARLSRAPPELIPR